MFYKQQHINTQFFFYIYVCMLVSSRVQLFATPWTVAYQARLSKILE